MIFPNNWAKSSLGEITIIKTGKLDANAAVDNGKYPFFTCSEKPLKIDHFEFDTEAVLLAGNGGFSVNWYKGRFNAYQRTYVIEPFHSYGRFVYRLVQFLIPLISSANRGSTIKYLRLGDISDAKVRLPPLEEQRRIADKLDTTLARVDALNDRLARITPLLKRFRQSVLAAATSGRLTEDWRNKELVYIDHKNGIWSIPENWKWSNAEEVCEFITKGTTPPKHLMNSGFGDVPYIKVYNLTFDGKLDFSIDPTFVNQESNDKDLKRSICLPGDVLMNIVGPPLGKVSVVPDSYPQWNINQAIARFRPKSIGSEYLSILLRNPQLINFAAAKAKATAGQFNLTLEICRNLPLAIPPSEEQTEIVRRVASLFAFADRLEARLQSAQTAAERLTPALLAKAFRGELVPQDPSDEPATELLRRLREARAAEASTKPKRGRAAKADKTASE